MVLDSEESSRKRATLREASVLARDFHENEGARVSFKKNGAAIRDAKNSGRIGKKNPNIATHAFDLPPKFVIRTAIRVYSRLSSPIAFDSTKPTTLRETSIRRRMTI